MIIDWGGYGPTTYDPMRTNISSSVETPKPTVQASQSPSRAPGSLSQSASLKHRLPTDPAAQAIGAQAAPLLGTREFRFTSSGCVKPLS